jgi:Predicted glycosyltransferases
MNNLALCICTYKRPSLLHSLLVDVANQTIQPSQIIIVDGDPESGDVRTLLEELAKNSKYIYIPSNHGNLPYQRYLGWWASKNNNADFLLYLDDDLRIHQNDAISHLQKPLLEDESVVGVTADILDSEPGKLSTQPILNNKQHISSIVKKWINLFGSGKRTQAGGLTQSGHRNYPKKRMDGYTEVQWLHGRVMFYRMSAINKECFSEDLFALDHIRCDLGEDTFLSRQIGKSGKLMLGFGLGLEHPNSDLPKCYPIEAKKLGYARAYSRRFLNDHYRITEQPRVSDRMALFNSYLGNSLINWWQTITSRESYQLAYARGYTKGALRGIFQKPTASKLTPNINWWKDAEEAIQRIICIQ